MPESSRCSSTGHEASNGRERAGAAAPERGHPAETLGYAASCQFHAARLLHPELLVNRTPLHKIVMSPGIDDQAALEDQDGVRIANRRQTVGNHDHGSALRDMP